MGNTRKWTNGRIKERYGVCLVDEPDIQSPAALALLVSFLSKKDDTLYNPFKWLRFRDRYLKVMQKRYGSLKCAYCGKDHLKKDTKCKENLATIDHVIPVSKGGSLWKLSNLVVACSTCNAAKADKMPENFVRG